jgi:hypothetical protein
VNSVLQNQIHQSAACHATDLSREAIKEILAESSDLKKLPKSDLAKAEHADEFAIPLYNVWKQQEKTAGSGHR